MISALTAIIVFFVFNIVFGILGFVFKITFGILRWLFPLLLVIGAIVMVVSFAVPIVVAALCVVGLLVLFGGASKIAYRH